MTPGIDPTVRVIGSPSIHPSSRIDAFCVITGEVTVGRGVHVAAGCRLIGTSGRLLLGDYSFVSHGSTILTASDDYVSGHAIGPPVPAEFRNVHTGDVIFEDFSGVGAHCVVMPGVRLAWGAVVGACSFITNSVPACEVWGGVPAKKIGERNRERLEVIASEISGN